jgi:hypothetical protein
MLRRRQMRYLERGERFKEAAMQFITTSTGKKRQMILFPDQNPHSLVMLYERGDSGFSFCLRDYSGTAVAEHYAREFCWSADEVRQRSRCVFDAPTVDTRNFRFWQDYTAKGNEYLRVAGLLADSTIVRPTPEKRVITQYPLLNEADFYALPKSAKTADRERIVNSPQSEDWLTWNLMNLVVMRYSDSWWAHIRRCAHAANPELAFEASGEVPRLNFWRKVPSPAAYEAASRQRMSQSNDRGIAARSRDPKPVEGNSEIDISMGTSSILVFIEAKLQADISFGTTYDRNRNQIVRNIDCLLESATARTPYFWMFVRDQGIRRAYVQLMQQYREHPEKLCRELTHRDPAQVRAVARCLTIITWREIAADICNSAPGDSELMLTIKREIARRIS